MREKEIKNESPTRDELLLMVKHVVSKALMQYTNDLEHLVQYRSSFAWEEKAHGRIDAPVARERIESLNNQLLQAIHDTLFPDNEDFSDADWKTDGPTDEQFSMADRFARGVETWVNAELDDWAETAVHAMFVTGIPVRIFGEN